MPCKPPQLKTQVTRTFTSCVFSFYQVPGALGFHLRVLRNRAASVRHQDADVRHICTRVLRREHLRAHHPDCFRCVRLASSLSYSVKRLLNVDEALFLAEVEVHVRVVAERHDAHARGVSAHLELTDDVADEVELFVEVGAVNASRFVQDKHDVRRSVLGAAVLIGGEILRILQSILFENLMFHFKSADVP